MTLPCLLFPSQTPRKRKENKQRVFNMFEMLIVLAATYEANVRSSHVRKEFFLLDFHWAATRRCRLINLTSFRVFQVTACECGSTQLDENKWIMCVYRERKLQEFKFCSVIHRSRSICWSQSRRKWFNLPQNSIMSFQCPTLLVFLWS